MMAGSAATKRIAKEIADVQSAAMRDAGIYYWYDDADMRKGQALIIGPPGTPYASCPLLFSVSFPADYPFQPPQVKFLTSDGATRFHPNLYVEGKVCLSILGTWTGPKWSAVMNVSTVLSSIQSLLEENPIVNEPSYEKLTLEDPRAATYAEYVKVRLVELSLNYLLRWKRGVCPPSWGNFKELLDEGLGDKLVGELYTAAKEMAAKGEKHYASVLYNMNGGTHWATVQRFAEEVLGAVAAGSSP
jgi:ubiquitin-protein ligase